MREKLIELIYAYALNIDDIFCDGCGGHSIEGTVKQLADYLIANGVTVSVGEIDFDYNAEDC